MKLEIIAAAAIAVALSMPVYAQDKPAVDTPKDQVKPKVRPHSHLQEKLGIKPSEQPVKQSAALDKSKHFHPRDR